RGPSPSRVSSHSPPVPVHSLLLHASWTPDAYTLSLHDALPIYVIAIAAGNLDGILVGGHLALATGEAWRMAGLVGVDLAMMRRLDRKSTRLNSSHVKTSYAVFCLKKKKCGTRDGSGPAPEANAR